uniref:DDE Tnp4 domain-containing protein n=1 Tax=Brassica oleracea var. oleracea TaxID=109376 RepID=A0A0D3BRH3_BRAOL
MVNNRDFPGWLEASTVCIGSGRIAPLPGNECIHEEPENQQLCWRPLLHMTSGYDTHFLELQGAKNSLFAKTQEFVRKDVERAFGVLQARFAVVRNPSNLWDKNKISNIMRACLIVHNMIVQDERNSNTLEEFQDEDFTYTVKKATKPDNIIARRKKVRDPRIHQQLKKDLIENI